VLRCGEVRLARTEVNQIGATDAKLLGFRGNGHGGGRLDALDPVGEGRGELRSSRSHWLAFT